MIPEPKHRIGDLVMVEFRGDIEGITCTVQKKLVVVGVEFERVDSGGPHGIGIFSSNSPYSPSPPFSYYLTYTLTERWPTQGDHGGKEYKFRESFIASVEPLANEAHRVKS